MGKNYCKVGHKWCKMCSHGRCGYGNAKADVKTIKDCLKRAAERTVSFKELLQKTPFEDVMGAMVKYWPDQQRSIEGYRNVYKTMLDRKSQMVHGFRICGEIKKFIDGECPVMVCKRNGNPIHYSCDGFKWAEINYMDVDKETLDRMSKEDIICGVLYEMTFNGFTEEGVETFFNNFCQEFKEMKE